MNTAAFQEGEYCMYFKNQINSLHIQRKPMKGGGTGNWNHIPSASLSAGCWAKPQGGLECCRGAGDLTLEVPCKNIPAVPHSLLCCCPSLVPCWQKSLPHSKQFLHTKLAFFPTLVYQNKRKIPLASGAGDAALTALNMLSSLFSFDIYILPGSLHSVLFLTSCHLWVCDGP